MKKNEMGGAYGNCGGQKRRIEGKDDLEDIDVDGSTILKWIFKK